MECTWLAIITRGHDHVRVTHFVSTSPGLDTELQIVHVRTISWLLFGPKICEVTVQFLVFCISPYSAKIHI